MMALSLMRDDLAERELVGPMFHRLLNDHEVMKIRAERDIMRELVSRKWRGS